MLTRYVFILKCQNFSSPNSSDIEVLSQPFTSHPDSQAISLASGSQIERARSQCGKDGSSKFSRELNWLINRISCHQSFFFYSYHYVLLRSGHSGQDIDTISWEISSLTGSLIDAMCPTRVENLLTGVLIQQDQVSLQEAQERWLLPNCGARRWGLLL